MIDRMTLFKIANGQVYDPANGIDGVVMDLWIQDGKIVHPQGANAPGSPEVQPEKVLDASGLVVMPGGFARTCKGRRCSSRRNTTPAQYRTSRNGLRITIQYSSQIIPWTRVTCRTAACAWLAVTRWKQHEPETQPQGPTGAR